MPDIRWDWINRHGDDIARATWQHLVLVVISVAVAIAIAVPLATLVRHSRLGRTLLGATTAAVYTIPSIALFAVLVTITGIGRTPAIVGLCGYALVMLVRTTLTGLDAVPPAVLDAAQGMGMSRRQLLQRVELPLAVPAILTGIRLATLETVAIATIAVFVAGGGLGELIYSAGISRDLFLTPIAAGTVMAIALALTLDGLLFAVLRMATRWQRAGGRTMSAVWAAFQDNEGWLRVRQHAVLSAVPLLIALVIGIPLGILAGRLGRVGSFVVAGSAFVTRMVPTFAVMALVMALTSIGFWPAVVGLVLLGIPSILLNTATGIREADPHAIDAARGMGYTEPQVLSRLQLPLALPHVAAGLRTAAVLTVSTAALAGLIGADGLGVTIAAGFSNNQDDVLLAGAIPVTAMALVADVLLIALQRLLTPVGLRRRSISSTTR